MSKENPRYLKWMRVTIPFVARYDNSIRELERFLSSRKPNVEFDFFEIPSTLDLVVVFTKPKYFQIFMNHFSGLEEKGLIRCP